MKILMFPVLLLLLLGTKGETPSLQSDIGLDLLRAVREVNEEFPEDALVKVEETNSKMDEIMKKLPIELKKEVMKDIMKKLPIDLKKKDRKEDLKEQMKKLPLDLKKETIDEMIRKLPVILKTDEKADSLNKIQKKEFLDNTSLNEKKLEGLLRTVLGTTEDYLDGIRERLESAKEFLLALIYNDKLVSKDDYVLNVDNFVNNVLSYEEEVEDIEDPDVIIKVKRDYFTVHAGKTRVLNGKARNITIRILENTNEITLDDNVELSPYDTEILDVMVNVPESESTPAEEDHDLYVLKTVDGGLLLNPDQDLDGKSLKRSKRSFGSRSIRRRRRQYRVVRRSKPRYYNSDYCEKYYKERYGHEFDDHSFHNDHQHQHDHHQRDHHHHDEHHDHGNHLLVHNDHHKGVHHRNDHHKNVHNRKGSRFV